jgi:hypothetical protein
MARKRQEKQHAAHKRQAQRQRAHEQRRLDAARREAEEQTALVYNPDTPAEQAARIVLDAFDGDPVVPVVAAHIMMSGGEERLRAISDAALHLQPNATALSLAADTALLADRPDEAERHVLRALEAGADDDLQLRLAIVRGEQGRLPEAVELLDAMLVENPLFEAAQSVRGELLERIHAEGGAPEVLARFADDGLLRKLVRALEAQVASREDLLQVVDESFEVWTGSDAISEEDAERWEAGEYADPDSPETRRLALIREWVLLSPISDDGTKFVSDELAMAPDTPPELARLVPAFQAAATFGLWEVGRPSASPGTTVTDLLTGIRLYAAIPDVHLEGLPRWSVLLGYLVPVDGIWRAGGGFFSLSPFEGRLLAQVVLAWLREFGESAPVPRKVLNAWLDEMDEEFGTLSLPEEARDSGDDIVATVHAAMRVAMPALVAELRANRGEIADEEDEDVIVAHLAVADPAAACAALLEEPDFEAMEDDPDDPDDDEVELYWLPKDGAPDGASDEARGLLRIEDDVLHVEVDSEEDLEELLGRLGKLGHPAVLEEEDDDEDAWDDDDDLEPDDDDEEDDDDGAAPARIGLPPLPHADLVAWLREWPDEPNAVFEDLTPRQASREDEWESAVEAMLRYIEHDADARGIESAETDRLRQELGLGD